MLLFFSIATAYITIQTAHLIVWAREILRRRKES